MAHFINAKCTSCTLCVSVCPTESIFKGEQQFVIDFDTCENCQVCVPICPVRAIQPLETDVDERGPEHQDSTENPDQPK